MAGLLGKLIATVFVAGSTLGGISLGVNYVDKRCAQIEKETGYPQCRELGYLVIGGFLGAIACGLSGGIAGAALGAGKGDYSGSGSSDRSERDPEKDDPGAFGPGGLRY